MKKLTLFLSIFLFVGLMCFVTKTTYGQVKPDSLNQNINEWQWRHFNKYERIKHQSIFAPTMSDDEMAGIELWRAGRNLKMGFSFMFVGVIVLSTAAFVADGKDQTAVLAAIGVVGTGFLIAGLCELVSGYNKIGKAGIILQHKKFYIKTTGSNISLNF